MKLAAKLILVFLVGVLCIVGVSAWMSIQQQDQWERERSESHALQLVDTLRPAIEKAYKEGGKVTVAQTVEFTANGLNGTQIQYLDDPNSSTGLIPVSAKQVSSVAITNADGTRVARSSIPLRIDGSNAGTVQVSLPLEQQDGFVRSSFLRSIFALVGVTMLSGLVIYIGGVKLVGRPLQKLMDQIHSIGEGNLDEPPLLTSKDEFGKLSLALSDMGQRLRQQRDAIRHTDRLGTVGTLAAGIAHELGTPLNVVSGQAGLIASGQLNAAEIQESATAIKEESERMTVIIRQLLDFARQKPSPHSPINVRDWLRKTCDLMEPLAKKGNVEIRLNKTDALFFVAGDSSQLQQVFTNLIRNAIDAMPRGGTLSIETENLVDSHEVQIRFQDNGVGIDAEEIPRVFEPFYTTKDVGAGTGLGLSIAYGIIRDHGGRITVESRLGQGTTFLIVLPACN